MKTTIDIAPELLEKAKRVAAERGITLKQLFESGLREILDAEKSRVDKYAYRPHTYKGKGLQEGLQEGDWNRIVERSYEGRGG